MGNETVSVALEREHRAIDEGIATFSSHAAAAGATTEPLTRAMDLLRRHIFVEEKLLFPPLRIAGLMAPVLVMLREHGDMWKTLEALDAELAKDPTSEAVLGVCRELVGQLDAHNSKEEPILYPQADRVLTDATSAEISAFLEAGQMPAHWVCERAEA